jgi:hypothetical protein
MTNDINGAVRQSQEDAGEDRVLRARIHLLAADDLLTEPCLSQPREYFTACGQVITDWDLPHAFCPDNECDCELRYCPKCIQDATRWNAELGEETLPPRWAARGTPMERSTPTAPSSAPSTAPEDVSLPGS